jgi:hypothetical protein
VQQSLLKIINKTTIFIKKIKMVVVDGFAKITINNQSIAKVSCKILVSEDAIDEKY